jgi:hypothetical protein
MSLKLRAKGVWYIIKLNKKAYAMGAITSTPATPETPAKGGNKDKINKVITRLVTLRIKKETKKLIEKLL